MKKLSFLLLFLLSITLLPYAYASEQDTDNTPFVRGGQCACGGTLYVRTFVNEQHAKETRTCQHGYYGQLDTQYQSVNRTVTHCSRCGQSDTQVQNLDTPYWYCPTFEQGKLQ